MAEGPTGPTEHRDAAGVRSERDASTSEGTTVALDASAAREAAAAPAPPTGADPEPRRVTADPIVEPGRGRVEDERAVVPLPGTHRQEPRPSLWKRISMRSGSLGETGATRVLARLDVVEERVGTAERSLAGRIQRLDERLSEVWAVEEQISQLNDLRETLDEIGARQLHLDERVTAILRRLTLLSVVVAAAVVAGVIAVVAG